MSELRDDMLYEICPTCKGTGNRPDSQGYVHDCFCKPLRVVPVGVTTWALERMARREIIEAESRRAGIVLLSRYVGMLLRHGVSHVRAGESMEPVCFVGHGFEGLLMTCKEAKP